MQNTKYAWHNFCNSEHLSIGGSVRHSCTCIWHELLSLARPLPTNALQLIYRINIEKLCIHLTNHNYSWQSTEQTIHFEHSAGRETQNDWILANVSSYERICVYSYALPTNWYTVSTQPNQLGLHFRSFRWSHWWHWLFGMRLEAHLRTARRFTFAEPCRSDGPCFHMLNYPESAGFARMPSQKTKINVARLRSFRGGILPVTYVNEMQTMCRT